MIKGDQKTALIDTVDPTKKDVLINNLEKVEIDSLEYVIANHAEQDHSGSIPFVLEKYPEAKVVTNEKCKNMLIDLLLLDEDKFSTVEDGDTLALGDKTLRFINTPWVHWPETMSTYLEEDKILFPCDFFGSHLATSDLFVKDEAKVYSAAKRYYAEIMMPFRTAIKRNMKKIEDIDIEIIASSHGPIYDNPDFIMDAYKDWISDETKNEVILPYVSMWGSTEKMVNHLIEALIEREITVKPYNLTVTDIGELAMDLVDASTIVLASPTVLTGPHPQAVYGAYLVNALRPKLKFASIIGSFGWGGKMVDSMTSMLNNLKVELFEPVIVKGHPRDEHYEELDELADKILNAHKNTETVRMDT